MEQKINIVSNDSIANELNIANIDVLCQDKGALDFTIRARLITAIERMKKSV